MRVQYFQFFVAVANVLIPVVPVCLMNCKSFNTKMRSHLDLFDGSFFPVARVKFEREDPVRKFMYKG